MIRKRKSLFWQIYLSYILITLWSLIMVAWYSSRSFKQFYLTKTTENLKCCAFLTAEVMAEKFSTYDRHKINPLCKKINREKLKKIPLSLAHKNKKGQVNDKWKIISFFPTLHSTKNPYFLLKKRN